MHAAAAIDREGELRNAVVAACLRFGRILLVAFETGDQERFPIRQCIGIARTGARRRRRRAIGFLFGGRGRAGETCVFLFRFLFLRLFNRLWRRRHGERRRFRRLRSGISVFSTGFSAPAQPSLRTVAGPAAIRSGQRQGPPAPAQNSSMITGALATLVAILVPARHHRSSAGGVKTKREREG